jgi:hypothetical protein
MIKVFQIGNYIRGRYCPGICLEGSNKTKKILSHYSPSFNRVLNRVSPEYEAEMLTAQEGTWTYKENVEKKDTENRRRKWSTS